MNVREGKTFQFLGENTQKAWKAKEDLGQEGTARRSQRSRRYIPLYTR